MPGGASKRVGILPLAGVALFAIAVGVVFFVLGLMRSLALESVDARFAIRGEEEPRSELVLVLIDERTFNDLGLQFPFPRSVHGALINEISRDDPQVIAYDVQFTEESERREDLALINASARAGNVVFSDTEPNAQGESGAFGGERGLRQAKAVAGNGSFEGGPGAVIRRMPFELGGLKGFAIEVAEQASGEEITPEDLHGESAWVDYAGPPDTFPAVSFSQAANQPAGFFRDKIVVVGASASTLQDLHPTSTTGETLMPGPEIQANAIATALDGFPLQSSAFGVSVLLIVALGLLAPAASLRLSPVPVLGVALGTGALYLVAAQLAFNSGRIIPVVYPLLALALGTIGAVAVSYGIAAFERQRTRDTFARFVPEAVVGEVLSRSDEDLRMGGRRQVVTVLFSDIRGFTTFSETRDPEQVIEVLNRYHGEMTEAVMDHMGSLISFMGDGIMAVFGAPLPQEDHADRALKAAREMVTERLPRFNEWMRGQGLEEFRIGIGLNSGPVMAGNVGGAQRFEYTTIGDTVNTAARLEGMTKGTPHQVFIADTTREMLRAEQTDLAYVDDLPIRGRSESIKVWTVIADGRPEARAAAAEKPGVA
jgi:adenylate cyclase